MIGRIAGLLLLAFFCVGAAWGKHKTPLPVIRWSEGQAGCTFSHDNDGKYRYGLWKDDFGTILAIDPQELQETRFRQERLFTLYLTIRYRGEGSHEIDPGRTALEFVSHAKVIHTALDPDDLSTSLQNDIDAFSDEYERDLRKHHDQTEEQKQAKQALLQTHEKELTEMQEFVTAHGLKPGTLDPGNRELSGWLFFSTKDKWIGAWKKQEQFLLRVPLQGMIFEFPFTLPPAEGEVTLRKRP